MKNKPEIYLALFIIAVVAGTVLVYTQMQKETASGMFPEKLGDMGLTLYRDGDAAMTEVKKLHGDNPNLKIEKAYIADYRGSTGSKAKFWVSESRNNEEAASLLELMNSRVGKTGVFSESTEDKIDGLRVYFVSGLMPEMGLYHYFYAKDKRVFWIQIDNPDEAYRLGIVKESIKRI
ncbi:MAG TPA: hypothetical protein VIO58_01720 [Candidatus Methanoperedens sp.]